MRILHGIWADATTWNQTVQFISRNLDWTVGGTFSYDEAEGLTIPSAPRETSPLIAQDGSRLFAGRGSARSWLNTGDMFAVNFGDSSGSYADDGGLTHQALEVKQFVDAMHAATSSKMDIVAHSMGGLAARAYLVDNAADAQDRIGQLVTYGTPHWGVAAAGVHSFFVEIPGDAQGTRDMDVDCNILTGRLNYVDSFGGNTFLDGLRLRGLPRWLSVTSIGGNVGFAFPSFGDCQGLASDGVVALNSTSLLVPPNAPMGQRPLIDQAQHRRLVTNRRHWGYQTSDPAAILCGLNPGCLIVRVQSPVELDIVAPDGRHQRADMASIPLASYMVFSDVDGHEPATVLIPFPEPGNYTILVSPRPNADPDATYTLIVERNGQSLVLAQDTRVSEIPAGGYSIAVEASANRLPIAIAVPSVAQEATSSSGSMVMLDGTASVDPDGDDLTYSWSGPFGTVSGAVVNVLVPIGEHTVTVTVDDGRGGVASAEVAVTVSDTRPPTIVPPVSLSLSVVSGGGLAVSASPALRTFLESATASDIADPAPTALPAQVNGADVIDSMVFPVGVTPVIFRFRDFSGNIGTATSTVRVLLQRDVNEDDRVDCADLSIVRASFGRRTGQPGFDARADVNGDGIVNVIDLSSVSRQLPAGTTCR